jgi:hypothetical protein
MQATTIFPYLFALIIGRFIESFLKWRLEKGIRVQTLAHLNGSTTLGGTLITTFNIRSFGTLGLVLTVLWSLSPLGSQASIRFISANPVSAMSTVDVEYLDTNSTYDSEKVSNGGVIFLASLLGSEFVNVSWQDAWKNVRIPMININTTASDCDGWIPIGSPGEHPLASLIGLPTSRKGQLQNAAFTIESSYWDLTDLNYTTSHSHQLQDITIDKLPFTKYNNKTGYASAASLNTRWQIAWLNGTMSDQPRH